jgi:hypothetical protein
MSEWDGRHSNYYGVRFPLTGDDLCWNCEIDDITLNNAPAAAVMHFCSPGCEEEWWANQPLANLVEKQSRLRRQS